MKTVLSICSSLHWAVLQPLTGNQEKQAFSMKDMEVGWRLRVCLTEVRMNLVDTRRWTRRDQRAGEWSINLSGEKRRITNIFLVQWYNLAFSSMFYGGDANAVCILDWPYTPAGYESAYCSAQQLQFKILNDCVNRHRPNFQFLC